MWKNARENSYSANFNQLRKALIINCLSFGMAT